MVKLVYRARMGYNLSVFLDLSIWGEETSHGVSDSNSRR